jgi:hypothetical protein
MALLIPAVVYIALVIVPIRLALMRYLLPISFIAALFAAYALGKALQSSLISLRLTSLAFCTVGCLLLLAYDTDLTYGMLRDSRYAAAKWLDDCCPGEDVGYFGPSQKLPRSAMQIRFLRVLPFKGTDPSRRFTQLEVDEMAEVVRTSVVNTILVIPEHWTPEQPYGTSCPTGLFEKLRNGSIGFRHTAHFETPPLLAWIRRPRLDYPTVNPPVDVFVRDRAVQ